MNCCFLKTDPLGTLEEEVLCLRLDSFKTAGNNFCGRSEDKFWRYLSLLLRHFCSGYYCTLAPKAIWGQTLFEVTFEFSNSKYWNFFYTFYRNECQKKILGSSLVQCGSPKGTRIVNAYCQFSQ